MDIQTIHTFDMINGKINKTGRAFYATHPESVRPVNTVQCADSLAQLDIWDIYRSVFPVDWLSSVLFFIDPSFRKQTHRRSDIHTQPGNMDTVELLYWGSWSRGRGNQLHIDTVYFI